MIKSISVLGSTGSIGTQTLDVARRLGIKVCALAAKSNIELLKQQIEEFRPSIVAVYNPSASYRLSESLNEEIKKTVKILSGIQGICECASFLGAEMVVNAITGMIGLRPTLAAIEAKKSIALANKETLVAGGEIVMKSAKKNGVKIFPLDSEHSAIFQCLEGCSDKRQIKRLILTASGGPFFGKTNEELQNVTVSQALKHPNWSMGAKISIDSATMMNKGLEIIEAMWLFGLSSRNIDVIVHRESIIHSMVEFNDNSVISQMAVADMRLPIQYALTYPDRLVSPVKQLDLARYKALTFYPPDYKASNCINICKKAVDIGGTMPTVVNAANEEAVRLFLEEKISFLDIPELVKKATECHVAKMVRDVDDIFEADNAARNFVMSGGRILKF